MSKLIPNFGQAILRPLEESEQKHGAIIIPNIGDSKPMQARIESISPTYNFQLGIEVPSKFVEGDLVLYPALGAQKVTVDREDFIICSVQDLLAKIEEEND